MIHKHNNKMNDPIDSNRYCVQYFDDVPTYVVVDNENNRSENRNLDQYFFKF
jgi:hypothetical protein